MDKNLIRKIIVCLIGSFFYASGVTLVAVCNLGISPIMSAPFAFSVVTGDSLGTCSQYLNMLLYVVQKIIRGKDYDLKTFIIQLILGSVFAVLIDFTGMLFGGFVPQGYVFRIVYLLFGCFVLAFGVTGVVMSGFGMLAGEGVAVGIQKHTKFEFGTCKIIFDCSMVALSIIISLVFLPEIVGVREGTLISAISIGWFAKKIGPFMKTRIMKFLNPEQ